MMNANHDVTRLKTCSKRPARYRRGMFIPRAASLALLLTCSSLAACSAGVGSALDEPAGPPPDLDVPVETVQEPLGAFNPCAPEWKLPTSARTLYRGGGAVFDTFEYKLGVTGATWSGSFGLPAPYRAIVRVDLRAAPNRVHSALWFMAVIPRTSAAALDVVRNYRDVAPVNARIVGSCDVKNNFVPGFGSVQSGQSLVVLYDPRCVCLQAPNASLPPVGISDTDYWGLPIPRP